jgi:hypothetical protein
MLVLDKTILRGSAKSLYSQLLHCDHAYQVFGEMHALQACFQIMIKLLSRKTLLLWLHYKFFVVDIKLKL